MTIRQTAVCLLLLVLSPVAAAQDAERAMTREAEALRVQVRALEPLRKEAPQRFIDESLKLADAYTALGKRYTAVSQSKGVRGEAVTILTRAAAAARYDLKQPRKAIEDV
jgi:hypothetical protein